MVTGTVYAWDDNGTRRKRILPASQAASADLGAAAAQPVIGYGAAAGEPGRLDLDVESLEAKLRFTLSSVLLIGSPGLMRDWPLRLLDPAALPALPTLPIGDARGSDWAAVRALIRQGAFSQDVYIASVDDSVGHGLFAGADIAPGGYVGEYTGVVSEDGSGDPACGRARTDGYRMRYPGIGLSVSALETGSVIRFVNHSESGANVNIYPVFVDGGFHMCCLATAAIPKHAQILLDYGAPYWRDGEAGQVPVEQSQHS